MAKNEDQESAATEPAVDTPESVGDAQGETQTESGVAPFDDEPAVETDPVVAPLDDEVAPDDEPAAEPCAECVALMADLELKTHLVGRLKDALGQASFDIVVDNSGAVIGPHSFEPGHKLAEVKLCEYCVSVQWLVDAVRGGRARVVKSGA